jgi:glycosyltransferase involved in cell wall biosynthesis
VAKKGYDVVLRALADLPADLCWRFVHIGGGELTAALAAQADALGLGPRIAWQGAQSQQAVLDSYRGADLFVLASRIAADGDRDGLPNVLMEAQSQALPCLATDVAGIPELIEADVTGLLIPPDDVAALSDGLGRLIREPALRARLGAAASQRMRDRFAHETGLALLAERFGLPRWEGPCESRSMRR